MRNDSDLLDLPALYEAHLPLLSRAIAALHAAATVDEAKAIRDQALAMRIYAQQAQDSTLEQDAAEIRIRAERRAGEMLAEMKESGARASRGQPAKETSTPTTLSVLGISRDESSSWQRIAAVPKPEFEQKIADARKRGKPASLRDVLAWNTRDTTPPNYLTAVEVTRPVSPVHYSQSVTKVGPSLAVYKEANVSELFMRQLAAAIDRFYKRSSPEQREGLVTWVENLAKRLRHRQRGKVRKEG